MPFKEKIYNGVISLFCFDITDEYGIGVFVNSINKILLKKF